MEIKPDSGIKRAFTWLAGERLGLDWKIAVLVVVSTLLLTLDYYHDLTPWKVVDNLIYYLAAPVLVTLLVFRQPLNAYGWRLGDWKAGLTITAAAVALMTPILWLLGHADPSMRDYYSWQNGPVTAAVSFLDLLGWEFMFRGWLLFGFERKFGREALWLQAVPFALAHLSKPEVETLSTIFGGFAFGWIAWRTRSFFYPLLIHWYIATLIILISAGVLG